MEDREIEDKVLTADSVANNKGFINRDVIKYVAMVTMLLNHIANIFLDHRTLSYQILVNIGYFTAITMCYFLVEGYDYTHSKKNYGLRLLLFGIISQIPFSFAFASKGIIEFYGFNMMFTLFLCFLIIGALRGAGSLSSKAIVVLFITFLTLFCDWGLMAPIFTVLFVWANQSDSKKRIAFTIGVFVFGLHDFLGTIERLSVGAGLAKAASSAVGLVVAGICILFFYNGKRMEKGRTFSKWFFYLFYPVHLLLLGIIKIVLAR